MNLHFAISCLEKHFLIKSFKVGKLYFPKGNIVCMVKVQSRHCWQTVNNKGQIIPLTYPTGIETAQVGQN